MSNTETLRRRIASFLKEMEALPPLESFPTMEPAQRADAMTLAWDLRCRAQDLSHELQSEARYGGENWTSVTLAAEELSGKLKRYDRCLAELLALTIRPVADCVAALRDAEESRIASSSEVNEYQIYR